MHAEKKRVFVGNLPSNTTQTDITKRFSKFGNVLSVEIKQRPDSSAFAFLDFETDEDKLNSCFATLSTKKWNGNRVKLELAKESFLTRLERERQENNKSQSQCSSDGPHRIDTCLKSLKRSAEKLEFTKNKKKIEETVSEANNVSFDEEATSSSDNSSDSEALYNGKLKMFSGTRTVICDSDNGSTTDRNRHQSVPESKISQSAIAATDLLQRLELFSDVWKDPPMNCDPTKHDKTINKVNFKKQSPSDKAKSELAEEKRKKSVDEKRKSFQKQKETIKLALRSVDSAHRNNKIVFDSEDENNIEDKVKRTASYNISSVSSDVDLLGKSNKKPILFEDSSDGEEEGNFKIKPQFEGSKGQKLLELQSRFASDKRFALDERFYESDEDVFAEAAGNVETAGVEERKRQFEILQDVHGHQVLIKEEEKDKSKMVSMLRFDPTKPGHAKYEKKPEPKIRRKVIDISSEKEPKVVYDKQEDKMENVVSKETFYKVAGSLKETLQKKDEKNEFSLRKLFGTTDGGLDNEAIEETYTATPLDKYKHEEWSKNPFKFDSSDSEEEIETLDHNKTENSKQNVNENQAQFCESFFFIPNDPRFQEGLEFFSRSQMKDESYDFAKHRRELKQIVRSKVKNNLRNHRPWKRKIGGHKAKKFIKKRYTQ